MRKYKKIVFVAGTARSGTTWVQEMINSDGSYRVLFEPFHSKEIESLAAWNHKQYLRKENQDEKYINPAKEILHGILRHQWIDQFQKNFENNKLLVKDIRANLLLKWINYNFPDIKIILLLRHPCAVANSKLNLGWTPYLNEYLNQQELMTDFLNPFKSTLQKSYEPFEMHIFMWCIENYVPLRQFKLGEIKVIFYENLCTYPKKEIKDLFSFINEDFSEQVLLNIKRPSALSQEKSAIVTGSNLVDSWREKINSKQLSRAYEILSIFGLEKLYSENPFPLLSGNDALQIFSS